MRKHIASLLLTLSAFGACSDPNPVGAPCEEDSNCNLSGGGRCILADTGNRWCAYPDPDCSGGYRFSDGVGDDLADVCLDAELVTLTVEVEGDGTISSAPTGLTCTGATCTGTFPVGTEVDLVATPTTLSFLGWSGPCRGIVGCKVTLSTNTTVGAFFGAPGASLWAKRFGASLFDQGRTIGRDSEDNLVIAGIFDGTVDFDGTMLATAGVRDMFVAKLRSTDGSVVWAKRFGGTGSDNVLALAVDETDNIYITGTMGASVDFGGGALPMSTGSFVAKLDAMGNHVWSTSFSGTGTFAPATLNYRAGKMVVGGYHTNGNITLGSTTVTAPAGTFQGLVVRMTAAGGVDWATSFGGNNDDDVSGIAIDGAGNVVATGTFFSGTTIGSQSLNSVGGRDMYLAKFSDASGAVLFATRFGTLNDESGATLTVDGADAIFLAGQFAGMINFGTGTMMTTGANTDAFLAKFSVAGSCTWAKQFGGAAGGVQTAARATSVSVNSTGDVVLTGQFFGEMSLGGSTLSAVVSGANKDVFAARLTGGNGDHISSIRAGGQGDESAAGVIQTSDSKYFVVGSFLGFADFGGEALMSAGNSDSFVFGMAPL